MIYLQIFLSVYGDNIVRVTAWQYTLTITSRFYIHWLVRACESILRFQWVDSQGNWISQKSSPGPLSLSRSLSLSAMVTDGEGERERARTCEARGAETPSSSSSSPSLHACRYFFFFAVWRCEAVGALTGVPDKHQRWEPSTSACTDSVIAD